MGSYAECWLGRLHIGSTKNDVDAGLMSLFRADDKRVIGRTDESIPDNLKNWVDDLDFASGERLVFYAAPVSVVRDRLELMGYTTATCRAVFEDCIAVELARMQESVASDRATSLRELYGHYIELLRTLNADSWIEALRTIHLGSLERNPSGPLKLKGTLIDYMLEHDWYGYSGPDRNVGLRLAIEALPDEQQFIYDLTDLVLSGYVDLDEDLVAFAVGMHASQFSAVGRTVILTEGRVDTWILSESVRLLYPHLANYFSFMDFEAFRVPGGSGSLANLTRAMAAAGIVNKVVALFDNDTAAAAAMRGLQSMELPANIQIAQLPPLNILRSYPTLGPTGALAMDINGIAASIELYLGRDVLTDEGGELIPVQWTGYDAGIGRYQGEILRKKEIQERFEAKLRVCTSDPSRISSYDWDALRSIWEKVFTVFHAIDGEEIRSAVVKYV